MRPRTMRALLAAVVLSLAAAGRAANDAARPMKITEETRTALQVIKAETIRSHMAFLADDRLEGREAGSPGYLMAAKYAADQFEKAGALPAGDNGTYFQNVPTLSVKPSSESTLTVSAGDSRTVLKFGGDFVAAASPNPPQPFTAPLVFAGYGIRYPDRQWDDLAGLELKDRIAVVLDGVPPMLAPNAPRFLGSGFSKLRALGETGARGILVIVPEGKDGAAWSAASAAQTRPRFQLASGGGGGGRGRGFAPGFMASIRGQAAESLFAGSGKTLAEAMAAAQKPGTGFALTTSMTVDLKPAVSETAQNPNVIAMVPGTDPRLKDECVIFSAHLDHVGVGNPVNGDAIHNGALDNASGSATVLSLAEAYGKLPKGPRRTMVFLLVTGEEKGFWGSSHYVRNPKFPLSKTAANINLDMIIAWKQMKDVVAMGAEKSSLKQVVEEAAGALGMTVSPDPFPQKRFFYRSDQITFARAGVPSMFLQAGFQWEGLTEDEARKLYEEWERTRYHQVGDEILPDWDFRAFQRIAQAAFLIGQRIDQDDAMPAWNKGDEFEAARLKSIAEGR